MAKKKLQRQPVKEQIIHPNMTDAQKAVIEEMTEPLQRVLHKIQTIMSKSIKVHAMAQYDIGELVNGTLSDTRKYGEQQIERLAKALGPNIRANTLWECSKIARVYSRERLQELLDKEISWSMLTVIARVDDEKKRLGYEKKVVAGEITNSKELSAELSAAADKESKVEKPTSKVLSMEAVNKQVASTATKIEQAVEEWNKPSIDWWNKDMAPSAIPEGMLDSLLTLKNNLNVIISEVQGLYGKVGLVTDWIVANCEAELDEDWEEDEDTIDVESTEVDQEEVDVDAEDDEEEEEDAEGGDEDEDDSEEDEEEDSDEEEYDDEEYDDDEFEYEDEDDVEYEDEDDK